MNKVFIVGRLTRPPEARTTTSGISVTTFTVAVTRRTNREEADFLNVVTWRGLADNCARYLTQGQQVAVIGELRTRSYEANDGTRRYVTEIQADEVEFLGRPSGTSAPSGNYQGGYQSNAGATNAHTFSQPDFSNAAESSQVAPGAAEDDIFAQEMGDVLIEDDDLPF